VARWKVDLDSIGVAREPSARVLRLQSHSVSGEAGDRAAERRHIIAWLVRARTRGAGALCAHSLSIQSPGRGDIAGSATRTRTPCMPPPSAGSNAQSLAHVLIPGVRTPGFCSKRCLQRGASHAQVQVWSWNGSSRRTQSSVMAHCGPSRRRILPVFLLSLFRLRGVSGARKRNSPTRGGCPLRNKSSAPSRVSVPVVLHPPRLTLPKR
jgi:hypothetical protein